MIRGYAEQPSPYAGGHMTLRVSTDAPRFRVEFHRYETGMTLTDKTPWLPGEHAPPHLPAHDWGRPGTGLRGEPLRPWSGYPVRAPAEPGVYVAVLVEGDESGSDRTDPDRTTPDGREDRALFVVRPQRPAARILYKLPLFTYHAYNLIDGRPYDPERLIGHWCLYTMPDQVPEPGVSLHRPGGGTGGTPWDVHNFDPYDPTPRQTFVHWDARFIAWAARRGYAVDYCTDLDLHREGAALLEPYRLMVSAGHDEYWSDAMRAAVAEHVAAGRNAAFFGGNTCWWRVVFHDPLTFSRVGVWHEEGPPENELIGVSFRNGGERDRDDHPEPVGYRVQHADHWVYEGTGLRDGDVFGLAENLVGYECDGADFDRAAAPPYAPTGADGTPAGFTILAVGDARASGWGFGNGAATMGLYEAAAPATRPQAPGAPATRPHARGGIVFNAATTDWPRGLATCAAVERITANVLDRLS
ncbi:MULTISPECIES: N,N-dimethylformamidase beta subunit family domain-containing protein [Nonomuraea]|uniref:N,N-dimethylformamidase beta subunit family domain-containing protein n=1 Tax=Nonomuraea salmonea TaxID=46181 RepID=A0ABV5NVK3_9ACTN